MSISEPKVTLRDDELLQRFCDSGDEDSFRTLLERYSTMVSSVCSAILRNHADVEDAFQATFFVLARRAARIRNKENIGAWLHRVALRSALTLRRRAASHPTVDMPHDFVEQELAKVSTRAMISALHEQLDRLPEKRRVAMIAVYLEGLDQRSAARKLGISEAAIQKRLERGRAMMRRRLGTFGFAGVAIGCLCQDAMAVVANSMPEAVITSTISVAAQVRAMWAKGAIVMSGDRVSLSLAQGVMKSMMFTSAIQSTAAVIVSASIGLTAFAVVSVAQDAPVGTADQPSVAEASPLAESNSQENGPPDPGVEVVQGSQQFTGADEAPASQQPPSTESAGGDAFQTTNAPTNNESPADVSPQQSTQFGFRTTDFAHPQDATGFDEIPLSRPVSDGFADVAMNGAMVELEQLRRKYATVQTSNDQLQKRVSELEVQLQLYARLQQLESENSNLRNEVDELKALLKQFGVNTPVRSYQQPPSR